MFKILNSSYTPKYFTASDKMAFIERSVGTGSYDRVVPSGGWWGGGGARGQLPPPPENITSKSYTILNTAKRLCLQKGSAAFRILIRVRPCMLGQGGGCRGGGRNQINSCVYSTH